MAGNVDGISRILLVRTDRLGDLILTFPAMHYVRESFPHAQITALVASRTVSLLQQCNLVDRILPDDPHDNAAALSRKLRAHDFDAAIIFNTSSRNCLAVWRAGIPTRVTWSGKPISWLAGNRRVFLRRSHPPIHESQFALKLAQRLCDRDLPAPWLPQLRIPDEVTARVRSRLATATGSRRPLFGIHPGNYRSSYNWPPERYAALINTLAHHGAVLVTGGPGEKQLLEQLRSSVPANLSHRIAWSNDFDVIELAAAIAELDVLTVSNTGPMHLAGILGTPQVALFSSITNQSAAKWAPLGQHATILEAPCEENRPKRMTQAESFAHMARISVEQVVQANLELLRSRTQPRSARAS
ncbi:MAG: ADP-heptose--LPS heptosyltransferase 2 [Planctomycetota bacterium]|jgi:ADP-heptose:LPS heptosyltransferase